VLKRLKFLPGWGRQVHSASTKAGGITGAVLLLCLLITTSPALAEGSNKCVKGRHPENRFSYTTAHFKGEVVFSLSNCRLDDGQFIARGTIHRVTPFGAERLGSKSRCNIKYSKQCHLSLIAPHEAFEAARYIVRVKYPGVGPTRGRVILDATCYSTVAGAWCE